MTTNEQHAAPGAWGNARECWRTLRKVARNHSRSLTTPLKDWRANRMTSNLEAPFVVLRHPSILTNYYQSTLDWLAAEMPEVRRDFHLASLPTDDFDWKIRRVLVPWIPDSLVFESPVVHQQLTAIEGRCQQHGVPIINPSQAIFKSSKLLGAATIATTGIRTPRAIAITHPQQFRRDLGGLQFPMLWLIAIKVSHRSSLHLIISA